MANPNYPNCSNSRYVPFGYGYGNEWNNWSNKQCSSDGDWDHLSAQGDCPCNEYVAAVVQDLNWNMEGILCCPGQYGGANLLHSACDVQTFYSTNSAAYGPNSPDWDPNYFKGQCPSGKYVAGISTVVDNYIGFTGAAHALHCCAD